jgi:hypothetical protein
MSLRHSGTSETGWPGTSGTTPPMQVEAAQAVVGDRNGGPLHAIPAGSHYPPFLRYPRAVVDAHLAERSRIIG